MDDKSVNDCYSGWLYFSSTVGDAIPLPHQLAYLTGLAAHKQVAEEAAARAARVAGHKGELALSGYPGAIQDALEGMRHKQSLQEKRRRKGQ